MTVSVQAGWLPPQGGAASRYPVPYDLRPPDAQRLASALTRDLGYVDTARHDHVVMTAYRTTCSAMGLTSAEADVVAPGDQDPGLCNAHLRLGQRRIALRDSPLLATRDCVEIGVRAALMDACVADDLSHGSGFGVVDLALRLADRHAPECMAAYDRSASVEDRGHQRREREPLGR